MASDILIDVRAACTVSSAPIRLAAGGSSHTAAGGRGYIQPLHRAGDAHPGTGELTVGGNRRHGRATLPPWLARTALDISFDVTDPILIDNSVGTVELLPDSARRNDRLTGTVRARRCRGRRPHHDRRPYRLRDSQLRSLPTTGSFRHSTRLGTRGLATTTSPSASAARRIASRPPSVLGAAARRARSPVAHRHRPGK